jgi:hypothetical protein
MRLGLKTFLAALLAAALVVPGATAKPGNGNGNGGNGGGKPSWAGPPSDRGGGNGGGKPDFAGQGQAKGQAKKAAKAAAKAERAQAKAASAQAARAERAKPGKPDLANLDELTLEDLEGLNPAWTCKTERALFGDSFAGEYGSNDNEANAFGMCVSEEAHERDGVSGGAVEAFCEPAEDGGELPENGICPGDDSGEGAVAGDLSDDGDGEGDLPVKDGGSADEGDGSGEPESILALLRSLF